MRLQPEKIKLGLHEWIVRPLTLRQVQDIEPILMESGLGGKGNIGAAMAIVAIAIGRDDPEAASNLSNIEATAVEIGVAMAIVLRLGGFIQSENPGEPSSGEASAGATVSVGVPASIS